MAKVTVIQVEPVVVLELSVAEAVYVEAALSKVEPAYLEEDTVYNALDDALRDAGAESDYCAAI